ncbi:MAG: hypothetical protein ABL921_20650 [Pirellula sp.]
MSFKNLSMTVVLGSMLVANGASNADETRIKVFRNLTSNLAAPSLKTATKIPWQPNASDAFIMAVDEHRPLVNVFTNQSKPGESNFSTKCLRDIEADGLSEFQTKAVFVNVVFNGPESGFQDSYGFQLARHLKITCVPTISYIAPNKDALCEGYRTEGDFSIEDIKEDMAKGIALAMHRDLTFCQPTPADLVRQLEEACKAGHSGKYAACFAEPVHASISNLNNAQTEVGNAKRRMLNAIDTFFGVDVDRMRFVDDDEEMASKLRQVTKVELIHATKSDGRIHVNVAITSLNRQGEFKVEKMNCDAVEECFGWRLLVKDAQQVANANDQHSTALKSLPQEFDRIADDVVNGKYTNAGDAVKAATMAYERQNEKQNRL